MDTLARGTGRLSRRNGAGVVFLLVLGILVVLVVLLFSQSQTQDQTGREISAAALGSRGRVAVESCLTEASYWMGELSEASQEEDPAYLGFRSFVPGQSLERTGTSLIDDAPLFLVTFPWKPEATRAAYQAEEDVAFGETRVGIVDRSGFEGEESLPTRDHRGVLGIEQEIVVTPPWGGFSVKVVGHYERAFRSVTLAVPAPFSRYSVLVQERSGDGNPLRRYHQGYLQAKQSFVAGGGDPASFPEFPVAGMEGSVGGFFVTTAPALPRAAWNVDALLSTPGDLASATEAELRDALAVLASGGWQRLSGPPVDQLLESFRLVDANGLGARSSYRVQTMADLAGFFGEGQTLLLDGVVHVREQISLEHRIEGRTVLWTDAPQGITVRGLEVPPEVVAEGGVVLVATQGDIRVELPPGSTLPASLLALRGKVKGLDGVTLQGHLLSGGFPEVGQGVEVLRPPRTAPDLAVGAPLDPDGRALTRVLFDSSWMRRDIHQRRTR